jgi:hypothetical protein
VDADRIHFDPDRARLTDVPGYDPELVEDPAFYANVYGWWGYAPYWGPRYTYPPSPHRR